MKPAKFKAKSLCRRHGLLQTAGRVYPYICKLAIALDCTQPSEISWDCCTLVIVPALALISELALQAKRKDFSAFQNVMGPGVLRWKSKH